MEQIRYESGHEYRLLNRAYVIKENRTHRRVIFPCTFMCVEETLVDEFELPILKSWIAQYGNQLMSGMDLSDISISSCHNIINRPGRTEEHIKTLYSLMFIQVFSDDGTYSYFVESSNLIWNIRAIEYGITKYGFWDQDRSPFQYMYDLLVPKRGPRTVYPDDLHTISSFTLSPEWFVSGDFWQMKQGLVNNMCTDVHIPIEILEHISTAMHIKYPEIDVRNIYIVGTPYTFVEDVKDMIRCVEANHDRNSTKMLILDTTHLDQHDVGFAISPIISEVSLNVNDSGETSLVSTYSMVAPHSIEIPNMFLKKQEIPHVNPATSLTIWNFFHVNEKDL